jgi:isopentenyl phosphate kinase
MLCAGYGRREAVEILLNAGANVHARDDGGLIPLHNACSFGHAEVNAHARSKSRHCFTNLGSSHFPANYSSFNIMVSEFILFYQPLLYPGTVSSDGIRLPRIVGIRLFLQAGLRTRNYFFFVSTPAPT